jgi:hypothetical protein
MKKICLISGFFVSSFFLKQTAAAQSADTTSLDSIVNRHIRAMGGAAKLATLQSLSMNCSLLMKTTAIKMKVTQVQGKLYRTDFKFVLARSGFYLATDTASWHYMPMLQMAPERLPDERSYEEYTLDLCPFLNYAAKGYKLNLLGVDTVHSTDTVVNGDRSYRIKLTTAAGRSVIVWINTKSYLIDECSQKRIYKDSTGTISEFDVFTEYTDYRQVNGIMFPFAIANKNAYDGNNPEGILIVNKIEVNASVKPRLYRPE